MTTWTLWEQVQPADLVVKSCSHSVPGELAGAVLQRAARPEGDLLGDEQRVSVLRELWNLHVRRWDCRQRERGSET